MIRAFDGGPEEATFTPVHIEMEAHMPQLVKVGIGNLLNSPEANAATAIL